MNTKWTKFKVLAGLIYLACLVAFAATYAHGQETNAAVQLTPEQLAKIDNSITQLIPLVPAKYQGVVAGAILLLTLAAKAGRVVTGYKAGGVWGAFKAVFIGSSTAAKVLLCLAIPALMLTGCGFNQNVHRGVAGVANGWQVGIGENPTTGLYELKAGNVDGAGVVVPIFYQTNKDGTITVVCPDVVLSNEKAAKATLFGSGGNTYTIAWGPNATSTLLGGQHYPINAPYWTNSAVGLQAPAPGTAPTAGTATATKITTTATNAPAVTTTNAAVTP